jgi:hypothetical protein
MFPKKLLMGRLIWLLENIYSFEHPHEPINMNRKLLTPVYKGVLIARDLEKNVDLLQPSPMAPLVNLQLETKL